MRTSGEDRAPDPPDHAFLSTLERRLRDHYLGTTVDPAAWRDALRENLDSLRRHDTQRALDRYTIVEEIARGGMGRVVLARDQAITRDVALKLVNPEADPATTARFSARLLAEANTVGQLQHPGIVPIHDAGLDDDGRPFFAMQLVSGRSLRDVLGDSTTQPRPDRDVLRILCRVCETMAYAHSRGVVHRDLKPANVMLGSFGEVYVMDWGLAAKLGAKSDTRDRVGHPNPNSTAPNPTAPNLTAAGTILGTPSYMPPERAGAHHGSLVVAPTADVYAVGAILYEVLTGTPPFTRNFDGDVNSLLETIAAESPAPVAELAPDTPSELAAICGRAMARIPGERYQSMTEFGNDLDAYLSHRVVSAHGSNLKLRTRNWIRRNRALTVSIGVAAFTLATVSIWFVLHLSNARDDAREAAAAASENLAEILDLAVVEQVADLRHRAEHELWPATAALVPAMRAWHREAESLRDSAAALRSRRQALSNDTLDSAQTRWRRRLLDDSIAALEEFFAPRTDARPAPAPQGNYPAMDSNLAAMVERIAYAEALDKTANRSESVELWTAARDFARSSPQYRGLELLPQDGLEPIGHDPQSGLLEFTHILTGAPAMRAPSGKLILTEATGIVLVLLPGGPFWMGADPSGPHNVDPLAETINETPVHQQNLAPFFIAKYEITQSQWLRATGSTPSVHHATSLFVEEHQAWRHPVESVDWFTARRSLAKLGLCLPTEARWEFAARGGTTTPWPGASTVAELLVPAAANLADASMDSAVSALGWVPTPGLDDGYVMHAPVGSFPANGFGLFDVMGNVAEWCADEYVSYQRKADAGTGGRPLSEDPATAMYRGGGFDQPAAEARSANRAGGPPTRRHIALGIRAARGLENPR